MFDESTDDLSDQELADAAPRCTDAANADATACRHGAGFRYVVEWDAWLAWNGTRWARTGASLALRRAVLLTARAEYAAVKLVIHGLRAELKRALLADKDLADELDAKIKIQLVLLKWHEQSQNSSRIKAAADILATILAMPFSDLDSCPWYFNVQNGTVDLRSAELLPHTREHYITQIAPVEWDDAASCPTWDTFIRQAMGGDVTMVMYLQRLVGYAATALNREHVLLFFWGGGNNGKGTFFRAIQGIFGEYGCAAPRDLLFQPKGGSAPHPSELARLYGKRLAICAEVGESARFDEAKIKDLTGGDAIACRRMNEDWWDFTPTHTLFLHGQHKPNVSGHDLGIWRRMRLIPWLFTIAPGQVDVELSEKLLRERSGILRWLVNGCLEWQRVGLEEPATVVAATAEYRQESDVLGAFLRQYVVVDPVGRVVRKTLRERYERWCEEAGHEPVGGRRMATRLRELGVTECNVRDGHTTRDGWSGIRLRTDAEMWAASEPATPLLS